MFFDIQPDSQEASKIIRSWSQKLPTSSQDRHLGCIWRPLGRHLGALGRHLGSSWGSWAPSWLVLGLLVAILPPKMSQHSSNMSQDSPNSNRHRPDWPLRDPRDLNFSMHFDLQSFIAEFIVGAVARSHLNRQGS